MRRVGRPSLGKSARQLIAIRLDPDVLKRLRAEARRQNIGYQTLINRVLAKHVGRTSLEGRPGKAHLTACLERA